jgi:glycosyltransferase involved in cell wall biosynthesis
VDSAPLITVITVVYNALEDLRLTAESVFAQPAWPNFEYIIVDGDSTDGTVDYLQTLPSSVRWISEPDNGIYDAMNKGIKMARGRGLLFLNAGDYFVGDVITSHIPVPGFLPVKYRHPVFGLKPVRLRSRRMGLPNCHQGIIFERSQGVLYDLQYRVCADYDFYLRHGYPDRLPMHSCSGYVYYDNSGLSQRLARVRDSEIQSIIQKKFGILQAIRFAAVAGIKRLARPLLMILFKR